MLLTDPGSRRRRRTGRWGAQSRNPPAAAPLPCRSLPWGWRWLRLGWLEPASRFSCEIWRALCFGRDRRRPNNRPAVRLRSGRALRRCCPGMLGGGHDRSSVVCEANEALLCSAAAEQSSGDHRGQGPARQGRSRVTIEGDAPGRAQERSDEHDPTNSSPPRRVDRRRLQIALHAWGHRGHHHRLGSPHKPSGSHRDRTERSGRNGSLSGNSGCR